MIAQAGWKIEIAQKNVTPVQRSPLVLLEEGVYFTQLLGSRRILMGVEVGVGNRGNAPGSLFRPEAQRQAPKRDHRVWIDVIASSKSVPNQGDDAQADMGPKTHMTLAFVHAFPGHPGIFNIRMES